MLRNFTACAFVLFFVILCGLVTAGELNPSSPPGSTMKTLDEVEPAKVLNQDNTPGNSSYEFMINQPGSYILTENVTTTKGGIGVFTDDVTIDLKGFKLTCTNPSPGYSGIYGSERSNIEVKNGSVEGFCHGVSFLSANTSNIKIAGIKAMNNRYDGIVTYGYTSSFHEGGGFIVTDCIAENNNDDGISVGSGSVVSNCIAKKNQDDGLSADGSCKIQDCSFYYNGGFGCGVNAGSSVTGCTAGKNGGQGFAVNVNCSVIDCTAYDNGAEGIQTNDNAVVENCSSYSNSSKGIKTGIGCVVKSCSVSKNSSWGIETDAGCTIIGNTVYFNYANGIQPGKGNVIKDNSAYENTGAGISATPFGCIIVGNSARANGNYGIYVNAHCTVDQNACYDNDKGGHGYANLYIGQPSTCAVGLNVAP